MFPPAFNLFTHAMVTEFAVSFSNDVSKVDYCDLIALMFELNSTTMQIIGERNILNIHVSISGNYMITLS